MAKSAWVGIKQRVDQGIADTAMDVAARIRHARAALRYPIDAQPQRLQAPRDSTRPNFEGCDYAPLGVRSSHGQ